MTPRSIEDYRARNEDAPLDLIAGNPGWRPVIQLINAWAKEKLDPASGYSSEELNNFSRTHDIHFPPVLREWWRLAGRHPFVEPGLLSDNAFFLTPHDRSLIRRPNFLAITIDDQQTWSGNGIHADFLMDADPEVH